MKVDKKEKKEFWVTIHKNGVVVLGLEKVECKIIFPVKVGRLPKVTFYPTAEQERILRSVYDFSFFGHIKRTDGKIAQTIESKKAYLQKIKWRNPSSDLIKIKTKVGIGDLSVSHVLSDIDVDRDGAFYAVFRLSFNKLLTDVRLIESHYKKGIQVKKRLGTTKAKLANGMKLRFASSFKFAKLKNETVVFDELIAEYEVSVKRKGIREIGDNALRHLDDYLLLASFASRSTCICTEYSVRNSSLWKTCYRGNRSKLVPKPDADINNALIDDSQFKDFMVQAYKALQNVGDLEPLRQALWRIQSKKGVVSDKSFLSFYSAVETLVYEFRKNNKLEFVVNDQTQWRKLKGEIKKAISPLLKQCPDLGDDSIRRDFIYQKLEELNRVSINTAVREFCSHYSVDLSDIWPLTGIQMSLSEIRNKLVHGYTFKHEQYVPLITAHEHLRWTLERMLLKVLGWGIKKSNVSGPFLKANFSIYEWQASRQKIIDFEREMFEVAR